MKKTFLGTTGICVVVAIALGAELARGQEIPSAEEWLTAEPFVRSDNDFFYARGIGTNLALARADARRQIAELVEVEFVGVLRSEATQDARLQTVLDEFAPATDEDDRVISPRTRQQIRESSVVKDFWETRVNAKLQAAEDIAAHRVGDVFVVVIRVPRAVLPAYLDVIKAWEPEPGTGRVTHVRTGQLVVDPRTVDGASVDDRVNIFGRDRRYSVLKSYGTRRISALEKTGVTVDMLGSLPLPAVQDLWVEVVPEAGVAINVYAGVQSLGLPAYDQLGLRFSEAPIAGGAGLSLEWAIGRAFAVSEWWLFAGTEFFAAGPITGWGVDVGSVKRFRLPQLDIGLGAALAIRWLAFDTTGTTIVIDGISPTRMKQTAIGAVAFVDFTFYIDHAISLQIRLGGRYWPTSRAWNFNGTTREMNYGIAEFGFTAAAAIRIRF